MLRKWSAEGSAATSIVLAGHFSLPASTAMTNVSEVWSNKLPRPAMRGMALMLESVTQYGKLILDLKLS